MLVVTDSGFFHLRPLGDGVAVLADTFVYRARRRDVATGRDRRVSRAFARAKFGMQ